ncbi:MAG: hypothetical protein AAGK14_05310 [Verrucomicrobiota bacterium]
MTALEKIIRDECLPEGDCMLTVMDANGEAGFLYFKDAELIESNYAALWGKEAVAELRNWEITEHTVAPLPLGIKRSLWDSLEALLAADPNIVKEEPSAVSPRFNLDNPDADTQPYEALASLPGVLQILSFKDGGYEVTYNANPDLPEQTDWTKEFLLRAKGVGETLGMGRLASWIVTTENYLVVGLSHSGKIIGIVRANDSEVDDFEQQCHLALHEL